MRDMVRNAACSTEGVTQGLKFHLPGGGATSEARKRGHWLCHTTKSPPACLPASFTNQTDLAPLRSVVGWTSSLVWISCCEQNVVCLRINSEEFGCPMTSVLCCVLHSEGSFENHILIKGQVNLQLVVKDINMDIPKLTAATNSCAQANLQLVVKDINMDIPKLTAATDSCAFGPGLTAQF